MLDGTEVAGLLVAVLCLGVVFLLRERLHRTPGLYLLIGAAAARVFGLFVSVIEGFGPAATRDLVDIVEHAAYVASTALLALWIVRWWWSRPPESSEPAP